MKNKTLIYTGVLLGMMTSSIAMGVEVKNENTVDFELATSEDGTLLLETENITFGSRTVSLSDLVIPSVNPTSIKVTEFSGLYPGWTLKVKLDEFTDASTNNKLINAKLFYPKVTPTTTTAGTASTNPPTAAGTNTSFNPDTPTLEGVVVQSGNADVVLASAAAGKGFGEWTFDYDTGDNKILLEVPVGQATGKYASTLTYTLEDTPTF